ncbi:MAG: leucyl/phenylalanyl-tRNA--protein transferase [Alphaproteobacteria bacterium]|nr:leucyl/phenylalanyl-tRNA--protein transferase [Alphaproteobacteria bacterium]
MNAVTPELVLQAYAVGLFPMAETRDDDSLYWIDPKERGILPLDGVHVPKSLRKILRKDIFEVRVDTDFAQVLAQCRRQADNRPESWINDQIAELYNALHAIGRAHSVECWRDGALVGGLYGVSLGGAFFGESMFTRVRDASKVALIHLCARLKHGGYALLDCQFITEHLKRFGAVEIPRGEYRERLAKALKIEGRFDYGFDAADLETFLQSSTQTS